MWAPPARSSDPAATSTSPAATAPRSAASYDGSDSVIRLSPTCRRTAFFAPSTWRDDNAQDLDLGSMSPVPVDGKIVIAGKRGTVYLLVPTSAGIGGEIAHLDGCAAFGGAAVSGHDRRDAVQRRRPCACRSTGRRMRWLWQRDGVTGSPAIGRRCGVRLRRRRPRRAVPEHRPHVGRVHVGDVTRFATPAPVGRFVLVGTTSGVMAIVGGS